MRGVTAQRGSVRLRYEFLLTRLMRGVTLPISAGERRFSFLLTRLMRGVTLTGHTISHRH